MKILRSIQNDYRVLGIDFNQPIENGSFNKLNLRIFAVFNLAIISNFVYFFHVAKTIDEFTISFFVMTSFIAIAIVYGIVLWNRKSIIQLANATEKLLNERMIEFTVILDSN